MCFSKRTFKTNGRMITVTWWRARTYHCESERDPVQRSVSDRYSVMFTPECGAAADSPHYMLMLATLIVSHSRAVYTSTAAVKICIHRTSELRGKLSAPLMTADTWCSPVMCAECAAWCACTVLTSLSVLGNCEHLCPGRCQYRR